MRKKVVLRRYRYPYRWKGVKVRKYKEEGTHFSNIYRQTIVGRREKSPHELRYFEIGPGGYSSLEFHRHTHLVIVLRGRGKVFSEGTVYELKPYDVLYLGPNVLHQFHQRGEEPFGFFCLVASERDRPRYPSERIYQRWIKKRKGLKRWMKR